MTFSALLLFLTVFQELMKQSSHKLFAETGSLISEMLVELPQSWYKSACMTGMDLIPFKKRKSDILLTSTHEVFGSSPFPLQFAGCKKEGLHVVLPVDHLLQNNNKSSKFGE